MKVLALILVILFALYYIPFGLYLKAKTNWIDVSLIELMKLRVKKIPTYQIINWSKRLSDNNMKVDFKQLVASYSSGVDMENVVNGLVKAKQNRLKLSFEQACEADSKNIDIKRTVINTIAHVGKEK